MSEHSTFVGDDRRGAVRYLHAIRQHWVLLLLLAVCSVATTWIFVSTVAKRYQATVDISVTPVTATDDTFQGLSVFRQSLDGSSTVVTAAEFLVAEIRLPAAKAMGPRLADAATITIIPVNQADVVAIRATAHTAKDAALAANIFAATATRTRTKVFQTGVRGQIDRIERQIVAIPSSQRATNLEYTTLAQKVGLLKSYLGSPDPTLHIVAAATAPATHRPGHARTWRSAPHCWPHSCSGADLPSCSSLPTHGSAVRTSFNSPSAFPYSRAFRACRGEWRTGTFWARASCPGPRGRSTGLSVPVLATAGPDRRLSLERLVTSASPRATARR